MADEIAALARRQHGYVTRQQLFALGETRHAVDHEIARGRLLPVYAGVYAVGHLPTLPQDRAFGAVLACGPGAVLSHDTAAAAWEIYRRWTPPFHVAVGSDRRRPGIRVHRIQLQRRDITRQLGLPVTSPARTLLDIAPDLNARALARAVNDSRRKYLHLADLAELLERCPRHPGAGRLREFVRAPKGPTRSEFEDAFFAFTERYGLPRPQLNVIVGGYEVDAFFAAERVVVELDGWDFHSSRQSFSEDRERDATLLALGIVTVRITWERLTQEPDREAARLLAILEQRRGQFA